MEPGLIFITAIYGFGVSWIQERFGKFQDLPPKHKQLVNAILALIVPAIVVNWLNPWWRSDFGNAEEFTSALLVLLAPVAIWLISQVAHYVDLWAKKVSGGE